MPVDPQYQHTWPVYYRAFVSTSALTVATVLAEAPNAGDVVAIPELYVVGRTEDAFLGNVQLGGYTLVNERGGARLKTETESKNQIGAGGLGVVVVARGNELVLEVTGRDRTRIAWGVYWRAVDFPRP